MSKANRMKGFEALMHDVIPERTPPVIAAEINTIKYQTGKIYLAAAVEIGRLLKEAKDLLPHGEWLKWLEESVSYSPRTAQKMMRVYEEYSLKQPLSLNAGADSPAMPNLNYSQALILLGVPEEERAEFILDLDIESMSARELQTAVDDKKKAEQEKIQALQENADLRTTLDNKDIKIAELTAERDNLKTQTEGLQKTKTRLERTTEELENQVGSLKKTSNQQGYERMQRNFLNSQLKVRSNHIGFLCETLDKTIKQLKWELKNIADQDKEAFIAYKTIMQKYLNAGLKEED
ncbi:DUF3102 domain-containing protein [Desulfosporosinus sp. BICA1-9]|uniref:DUF3102 domain-containing protein n=1 Tax=Desulfosporosinus sp. BICA1-9 TaxID=1531958 RepID=UPI000AC1A8DD|nr:DUF3102 domain-containing protein [Desulfosporosinus sp. BICA1-9]